MDELIGNRHQRRNYDDLRKMKVKGWGGKMMNRESWRLIVQEAKAHPEL
jgi:hypothetical protein